MLLQDLHSYLTPQKQAHIYATGLVAIITLGTLALVAVCLAALWLVLQFAVLLLTTIIASCNELVATFAGADPFVKLLALVCVGFVLYKIARKVWR